MTALMPTDAIAAFIVEVWGIWRDAALREAMLYGVVMGMLTERETEVEVKTEKIVSVIMIVAVRDIAIATVTATAGVDMIVIEIESVGIIAAAVRQINNTI